MPDSHDRRLRRAGIVAVFTLGFTALASVLTGPGPNSLAPAIAVAGWFLLTPYVAMFDLPVIDDGSGSSESAERTPLESLRDRYAVGEMSEEEFDRKVEKLLATEQAGPPLDPSLDSVDAALSDDAMTDEADGRSGGERDPSFDLDTE